MVLSAQNLTMAFGERTLFEGASFDIAEKERVGFVGANGTGKTTLFKLATGELEATSGEIHCGKNIRLGYMEQHACANSARTVYDEMLTVFAELEAIENELETLARKIDAGDGVLDELIERQQLLHDSFERGGGLTYKSRTRAALLGLGFSQEMFSLPCGKLSGGQRSKLSLGKLLLSGTDFLLLDEPTNHLDIACVEWLEGFLREMPGAALIISHDRYFLDRVTTKTLALEHRKLKLYNESYSGYIKQREKDKIIEQRHYDNTMAEIHRIEGIIAQQKQWNRERNIRTAEHKQKSIDRLSENLEKPEADDDTLRFDFNLLCESGDDVLEVRELSKSFGAKPLFKNISFEIKKGERIFLLGPNGCGKTTLLRVLVGQLGASGGTVRFGTNVKFGYFDQSLEGLHDEKTVLDEVWDRYRYLPQTQIRNALAAFLFKGEDVYKIVGDLSGGEKARTALLRLMLSGANLLLLDEPTNHLDITSREALEKALSDYAGTLLIVSHDRYFINKLSTGIVRLTPDGAERFEGDYDTYLERLASASVCVEEKEKPRAANDYKLRKERESEQRRLRTALSKAEERIAGLEQRSAELESELSDPETVSDYEKITEITAEHADVQKELSALYAEWERLASLVSES